MRITAWLDAATDCSGGMVEIILTSADPDDLTLRQARWLGSADLVSYEPGEPPAILARARADAVQQALGEVAALARCSGLTVIIRQAITLPPG